MPQQINLSTPILLSQKRYFSAQTMALTLAIFAVVGAALCEAWVWNLQSASAGFAQTMSDQAREVESLQAAIQRIKDSAAPADAALVQQLQEQRKVVQQKAQLLAALKNGMFVPGEGHSDRLQWVARSIPTPVWVTEIKADTTRFEVTGFTLEPAALNAWVDKLSESPLMQGLKLATVKVENTAAAVVASRAAWSFNLVSLAAPSTETPLPAGGKP
jgi:Tfp pilus assembly protein PilN